VLWVLVLDNTIPGKIVQQINKFKTKSFDEKISLKGTDKEKGLTKWLAHPDSNTKSSNEESAQK
jgi:hypothetical protein